MENLNVILLPPTATRLINEVMTGLVENKRNPQTELVEVGSSKTKLLQITFDNRPNAGGTAQAVKAMTGRP